MSSSPVRPPRRIAPTNISRQTRMQGRGSGTATPEGSATQTITSVPLRPDGLVLRLRGPHSPVSAEQSASDTEGATSTSRRRRIQWAEDVIDNEGLGRKKSKVCCIFHKNREVGESSDEDDSSSSSDSDGGGSGESDDGGARMAGGKRGRQRGRKPKGKGHEHGKDCGHGDEGEGEGGRRPSPNAYERMPKYDVKPLEKQPGK